MKFRNLLSSSPFFNTANHCIATCMDLHFKIVFSMPIFNHWLDLSKLKQVLWRFQIPLPVSETVWFWYNWCLYSLFYNPQRTSEINDYALLKEIQWYPRYFLWPLPGGTRQRFMRGGSTGRCTPYHFWRKRYPRRRHSYTFYWQMVLLSRTLYRTLHPY